MQTMHKRRNQRGKLPSSHNDVSTKLMSNITLCLEAAKTSIMPLQDDVHIVVIYYHNACREAESQNAEGARVKGFPQSSQQSCYKFCAHLKSFKAACLSSISRLSMNSRLARACKASEKFLLTWLQRCNSQELRENWMNFCMAIALQGILHSCQDFSLTVIAFSSLRSS